MVSEETIRDALRDCYDPEIPRNIVELGLVENVMWVEDHEAPGAGIVGVPTRYRVSVAMIPTSRDEVAEAQLVGQVRNRLAGIFELSSIAVEMKNEPVWTPARITAAGRKTLGMDQPQFPILNNKVRAI
jgi:metal-sulfur cluster biosynthetic enzyme